LDSHQSLDEVMRNVASDVHHNTLSQQLRLRGDESGIAAESYWQASDGNRAVDQQFSPRLATSRSPARDIYLETLSSDLDASIDLIAHDLVELLVSRRGK